MTSTKTTADELLPPSEAASYTLISDATLAAYRSRGVGPAFVKFGNRVFYQRRDLDEWIASRRVRSTAEGRALESHSRKPNPRRKTASRQWPAAEKIHGEFARHNPPPGDPEAA